MDQDNETQIERTVTVGKGETLLTVVVKGVDPNLGDDILSLIKAYMKDRPKDQPKTRSKPCGCGE